MQRLDVKNTNGTSGQPQDSIDSSHGSLRKSTKNWRVVPSDFVPHTRSMNGIHSPQKLGKSTNSLDPKNLVAAATLLGSIGSLKAAEVTEQINNNGSSNNVEEIYTGFDFPFENLVFEGGGNKGMAYVGALQVFTYGVFISDILDNYSTFFCPKSFNFQIVQSFNTKTIIDNKCDSCSVAFFDKL